MPCKLPHVYKETLYNFINTRCPMSMHFDSGQVLIWQVSLRSVGWHYLIAGHRGNSFAATHIKTHKPHTTCCTGFLTILLYQLTKWVRSVCLLEHCSFFSNVKWLSRYAHLLNARVSTGTIRPYQPTGWEEIDGYTCRITFLTRYTVFTNRTLKTC